MPEQCAVAAAAHCSAAPDTEESQQRAVQCAVCTGAGKGGRVM